MLWFDTFVENLMGNNGGPYMGNLGAPVTPNPKLVSVLNEYLKKREHIAKINKRKNISEYYTESDKVISLEKRISELEEIIKNNK